jgi:autotransporter-associated beta strand protein
MQDASFPTQFQAGGDFFNQGSTELGMWANQNSTAKQVAGWANFSTSGFAASGGSSRSLQIGDVFTITVAATRAFGQIGFSLNAGGTQGGSYANNISGSRMYISTDNYAAWSVKGLSGGGTASLTSVPLQDTFKDYRFTVRITSLTTADATLTVDGTDYRAYNLSLSGSAGANISALSLYGSDMWDGNSNENAFWKPTSSVQDTGRVELGYFLASSTTFTPGQVTDGLDANSATTAQVNNVFVGGDASSQVNLNQANTYTGTTTINANAMAEAQNANALGSTAAGTTVSSGGALKLFSASSISFASEALTLNGTGVSGANGALRNVGGTNTWNGAITLGSNTRINADTVGSSGSLTISGNIAGGANVLFLGAQGGSGGNTGGNISISGGLSGAGSTQNSTTTSIYKDGAGVLTLSGDNTYSGDTRITAGQLTVDVGGDLGNGETDVFISSGAQLNLNTSVTVDSVSQAGDGDGGTINLGPGATLTLDGANKGSLSQNSISGAGNLSMGASGTTALTLYGTQSYTGSTAVTGGKISTGVSLATSQVNVSGGTFEASAADILSGTAAVSISGTGTFALGGNDTVGSFNITGGELTTTNGATLTAATYILQGGTVGANLGAGNASASTGTTALNGTLGGNLTVNGGTVNLGSANRLADNRFVTVSSSGTLGLGANNDTISSFTLSDTGTLGGSGTLTAATYSLQGGTVTAGLGAGAITVTTGTTTLGSAGRLNAASTLAVNSGQLNLGGAETVAGLSGSGGTVNLGAHTLTAAIASGTNTYAGAITGTGGLTKTGIGRLSLSGSSSYNGATAVSAGDLNLSGGSISNSAVTVASGASLSGYGSVGTIGGAGAINPGNSPGILTTPQVNPSAGTDFNFEMTGTAPTYNNAASSVNDVIRITGVTPFSQALAAGNGINIYFSGAALFTGSTAVQYQGGFFTDQSASFASSITNATYNYYFADEAGSTIYNGASYYTKGQYETAVLSSNLMTIIVTTVAQTANFGGDDISGQVMQVQVIPEPSTYALLALSAAAFGAYRWRRRRRG